MRIWRCPRCNQGRKAPDHLKPLDVRRYCFPCSEEIGLLVEMSCPSKEREKAEKAERRREKAARQREARARQREAQYFLGDGTDLRVLLKEVKAQRVWKKYGDARVAKRVRGTRCDLVVTKEVGSYRGEAFPTSGSMWVKVHPDQPGFIARLIIIHELCHIAMGMRYSGRFRRRVWHDDEFHALLLGACREAFPGLDYDEAQAEYGKQGGARRRYSMDRGIETLLWRDFHQETKELASSAASQKGAG